MKNILRLFLLGVLTWIVPFIVGFLFFDKTGQLAIDIYLFKTIMIIVGGLIGSFAIVLYFKKKNDLFLKHGVIAGITWFAINNILDILILVPMTQMSIDEFISQIGLRYLLIPIMCILCGYLLNKKQIAN
ncbi:hypothetical protein ACFLS4_03665 [Bacteroidota bacterium]